MGYYSHFNLSVSVYLSPLTLHRLMEHFYTECDEAKYALCHNGASKQEAKWYDARKDLAAFSTHYPDLVFLLSYIGEEGEKGCYYVLDGRSYQHQQPDYEPPVFDPSKLET